MLQFNLERRDRCRREYVLLEPGASFTLLELLEPVVEQNHTTLSMGNRLEVSGGGGGGGGRRGGEL